ncbi:hypothetical protein AVEN_106420-1 [Araneus ventricosus]|uniref:Uncharacterized protein n=1 Tax=Araneus ventricosus TaxID=182803 RepID=A0A4Y2ASW5_ARAVE|nr:hypothetical protein AVEN_106420-1 [Araneus ventricosus]
MCGLGGPSTVWGNHLSSWVRRGDEEHGVTLCALCALSGRNRRRWCALTPTWIPSRTWSMPARARSAVEVLMEVKLQNLFSRISLLLFCVLIAL